MKLSFIGLGVMGYPMAGFLSKSGYDVTVFNRTKSKAENGAVNLKVIMQKHLVMQFMMLKWLLSVSETMMT
jgi:3-hydroxyisobutyrate dehydrogenase-like beta-hydroxyacid dehydrogenase